MCGDAVVGHGFHFFGANLYLDGNAVHAEQGRMQGLVAIGLGNGDVVFKTAWYRFVQAMDSAQHPIAGIDAIDDDPKSVHVHDLRERPALAAHFFIDAIQVFFPTDSTARKPFALEACLQRSLNLGHNLLTIAADALDRGLDSTRAHRVERFEAQLLELDTHAIHAQPICYGGIDIQGFPRNTTALIGRQHIQRAHIVEAVSNLDQDNPQVLGHGHGHLLKVFCLRLGATAEGNLVEFADAVYQISHGIAKLRLDRGLGDARVFDYVMEHGGHQTLMVHVHFA